MRQQLFYDPTTLNQLTPRENSVLLAAKKNQPLDTIANSLDIPQTLVVRHLSNIINKLHDSDKRLAYQLKFSYDVDIKH